MRKLLAIALLVLIAASAVPSSAYVVPAEYRTNTHMNDVEVYQVSIQHQNTQWGLDNLRQIAINYTNSGTLSELKIVMRKYGVK